MNGSSDSCASRSRKRGWLTLKEEKVSTPILDKPMQIAWMEVLETGVGELDAWHRQLIHDLNDLLWLSRTCAPWSKVCERAELLAASCIDHFRFEEAIMTDTLFPRRRAHADEHRRIEEHLEVLLVRMRASDGGIPAERARTDQFLPLLVDVMVGHDLDYRSHLLHQLGR